MGRAGPGSGREEGSPPGSADPVTQVCSLCEHPVSSVCSACVQVVVKVKFTVFFILKVLMKYFRLMKINTQL